MLTVRVDGDQLNKVEWMPSISPAGFGFCIPEIAKAEYSAFEGRGLMGGFYLADLASNTDNGAALIDRRASCRERC